MGPLSGPPLGPSNGPGLDQGGREKRGSGQSRVLGGRKDGPGLDEGLARGRVVGAEGGSEGGESGSDDGQALIAALMLTAERR